MDLLQRRQEVHRARGLAIVELLTVQVDLEPATVRRSERDRGFPVVDRRELGRHTDGHGEIPSDDAVDDLDVALAFGHGGPPWSLLPGMVSVSGRGRNHRDTIVTGRPSPEPRSLIDDIE